MCVRSPSLRACHNWLAATHARLGDIEKAGVECVAPALTSAPRASTRSMIAMPSIMDPSRGSTTALQDARRQSWATL